MMLIPNSELLCLTALTSISMSCSSKVIELGDSKYTTLVFDLIIDPISS